MGRLSTHVLDTALGKPGADIALVVERIDGDTRQRVAEATTNDDGRCDKPLLEGAALIAGEYEIRFALGPYFDRTGAKPTAAPPGSQRFLDTVVIRFGVANADEHYHVPLLISPFAYSTYRGS